MDSFLFLILCNFRNCIIDKNAKIGRNVVIANTEVSINFILFKGCSARSFNTLKFTKFKLFNLCLNLKKEISNKNLSLVHEFIVF